ncbi:MAG: transposase [Bacteroidales bacterium]|nr:transposase [Bacteroidales bacterium]
MPIITCSGKRKAKVATEMTDKSFCSTKNLWYYRVKLHALAFRRPKTIPYPESIVITNASENDLNVFKHNWAEIINRTFYGDKIYIDEDLFSRIEQENNSKIYTPIKESKCKADSLKKIDKAFKDLYSTAVSKMRQPIESFFNWLIQKNRYSMCI